MVRVGRQETMRVVSEGCSEFIGKCCGSRQPHVKVETEDAQNILLVS